MEKKYKSAKSIKAAGFLKRNAYYIAGGVLLLAAALTLTLVFTLGGSRQVVTPPDPEIPVGKTVTFVLPVEDGSVALDFSSSTHVWNPSLKEYAVYEAMAFVGASGANVLAVYEGTVESVETTLLDGTVIVIDHGDGLRSVYKSLADTVEVAAGDKVTQGQVIGSISASQKTFAHLGEHLHLEVYKNGEITDPAEYMPELGDK